MAAGVLRSLFRHRGHERMLLRVSHARFPPWEPS
jgi:hypothetical protein